MVQEGEFKVCVLHMITDNREGKLRDCVCVSVRDGCRQTEQHANERIDLLQRGKGQTRHNLIQFPSPQRRLE